jgi:S-methylmethionine-dependent homocysteine/selenocysteine methylase
MLDSGEEGESVLTILDGGMGGELIRREATPRGELWSAQALIDAPDKVLEVQGDYIAAGAEIIITNSSDAGASLIGGCYIYAALGFHDPIAGGAV